MNNIKAIFFKQFASLIKVPALIIQGILYLFIALVFVVFVGADEPHECANCIPAYVCEVCAEEASNRFQLPVPSMSGIFTVIFVGLGLVSSSAALVYEDRSTRNLQFMGMANVKPYQYLFGTLSSIIIVVSVLLIPFALVGSYFGINMLRFMALCMAGGLVAILFGIVIGLSKYPVLATPISIILGLGPTIVNHNERLANILRLTFIQQVNLGIAEIEADLTSNFLIIGANGLVVLLIFIFMHRKNKFNV